MSTYYSFDEIKKKMAEYCVYQDRCHAEVSEKLSNFELIDEAKEEILIFLIQYDFLNEERFSKNFCRGKFYQKKWGKRKIIQHLKIKKIPDNLIKVGIKEINAEDYHETLHQLALKKHASLSSLQEFARKTKTIHYLLQKGYESELIYEVFN